METAPKDVRLETLLAHADWVRALAGRLVADPGRADDIAQDTWVAAIESPPRDARNVRAWLGAIVRNTVREQHRGEKRRSARERAVSKPEASAPSSDDLVQRATLQREIVGHVLALDEPYRTVVLMRWFEGLPPREIAARLDRPAETVTMQLTRAHEKLRAKLDGEYGDRSSWRAAFAVLVPKAPGVPAVAASGAVFAVAWKLALAAVVVASAWLAYPGASRQHKEVEVARSEDEVGRRAVPAESRAVDPLVDAPLSKRVPFDPAGPSSSPAITVSKSLGSTVLEGRVIDSRGAPIADLPILGADPTLPHFVDGKVLCDGHWMTFEPGVLDTMRAHPRQLEQDATMSAFPGLREAILGIDLRAHGRTTSDGSFRLEASGSHAAFALDDDRWTIISHEITAAQQHVFVVAPVVVLEGLVVDETESPIPKARFDVSTTFEQPANSPEGAGSGVTRGFGVGQADEHGRFRLEHVPACSGARLSIQADKFDGTEMPVPDQSRNDMRVTLRRTKLGSTIRGLVLDADGGVADKASVRFGQVGATTDAHGRFEMQLRKGESHDDDALIATRGGVQAAVLEDAGQQLRAHPQGLDGIILRLGGPALTLTGRVVEANGSPCKGWMIKLADALPYGSGPISVEFATAGWFGNNQQPKTAKDGSFRLAGLRDRDYRVRAIDPRTGLVLTSDLVHAGSSGVEMRAPADALVERVSGRVLSKRGVPIHDAEVVVLYSVFKQPGSEQFGQAAHARTDRDGRFELTGVPRVGLKLSVDGPHLEIENFDVEKLDDIVLNVTILCRLRIECAKDDPTDGFELLDTHGKPMVATAHRASSIDSDMLVSRDADGLPLVEVGEEATTLVLFKGHEELRRIPIVLNPAELIVVRP